MRSLLSDFFKKLLRAEGNFKIIELPPINAPVTGFPFDAVVSEAVDEEKFDLLVSRELLRIVEETGSPPPHAETAARPLNDPRAPPLTDTELRRFTAMITGALRRRREVMLGLGELEEGGRLERLLARFTVLTNSWTRSHFQ